MTNPYELNFTLKQHTPIIHFQHDQDGATLRASEVKPKLDRFIINKIGAANIPASWYSTKGKEALNYQLKFAKPSIKPKVYMAFSSNENPINDQIKSHAAVDVVLSETANFADSQYLKSRKNSQGKKELDVTRSNLKEIRRGLQFGLPLGNNLVKSHYTELLNCIKNNLQEFFLLFNFGFRQNKGFGSYTITEINGKAVSNNLLFLKANNVTHCIEKSGIQQVLKEIQIMHKLLKSGINLRPFGRAPEYQKAQLFFEFAAKDIRWEKRYIKKQINGNKINGKNLYRQSFDPTDFIYRGDDFTTKNQFEDIAGNDAPYKYVRALLGLAEHYEFLIDNGGRADNLAKYYVTITHDTAPKTKPIERFQSPILYKVIDDKIYPIPKEIPEELRGALFRFSYKIKSNNGSGGSEIIMQDSLPVPDSNEFNLREFLATSLNELYPEDSI